MPPTFLFHTYLRQLVGWTATHRRRTLFARESWLCYQRNSYNMVTFNDRDK